MNNDHNIHPAKLGTRFQHRGEHFTVQKKCTVNHGNWFCLSCKEVLDNQLQKDCHISAGRHVLVWVCSAHGPEVP